MADFAAASAPARHLALYDPFASRAAVAAGRRGRKRSAIARSLRWPRLALITPRASCKRRTSSGFCRSSGTRRTADARPRRRTHGRSPVVVARERDVWSHASQFNFPVAWRTAGRLLGGRQDWGLLAPTTGLAMMCRRTLAWIRLRTAARASSMTASPGPRRGLLSAMGAPGGPAPEARNARLRGPGDAIGAASTRMGRTRSAPAAGASSAPCLASCRVAATG